MERFVNREIMVYKDNLGQVQRQNLIVEEPLAIRIDGQPYSVVMRTPGNELAHAAGFCLAEGLLDHPDDIATIGFCAEEGTNVATVTLKPERRNRVAGLLERRGFVSQTSCGICGKELVRDLNQIVVPSQSRLQVTERQVLQCADKLPEYQELYRETRAAHAALLFNSRFVAMATAEDVGRHNALDKVIGEVFLRSELDQAVLAVLSSRISYELVQKAGRAGLSIVVGMSRPTALAVELAESLRITVASVRSGKLLVFCGQERIGGEPL